MSHDGSDAAAGSVAPVPAQTASRPRVLVIEDEPNISEAIRYILQRDGWETILLATGDGALEAVAARDPGLVILDVMLPGVSGLEILRALRAQPGTADLPVILLTAKGSAQVRDTALEAGASLFMAKPFANSDLLAAVRQLAGAASR